MKNWYLWAIALILFLSLILRFYGYDHRWGLAYDQAHDAIVGREALIEHKIPAVGPFSSAGPFVTGPEWYWFIALATAIAPQFVITPWVVLTLLFVGEVYIMIKVGEYIGGKPLGIILGLLVAVSSAEISQSVNLTNQAPIALLSALAVWIMLKWYEIKQARYTFFLGLIVSLAINTHLEGVLLLPFFIFALLSQRISWKTILGAILGFILPFIPLILFDLHTHFYDIRHMLQYYLHDQYQISLEMLGRSWKRYAGMLLPQSFGYIIGGFTPVGYAILLTIPAIAIIALKKRLPRSVGVIGLSLFTAIVVMRYTRTPLFDSYFMFLHAWIFVIVSWVLLQIWNKNKITAMIVILLLVGGSLVKDIQEIKVATNQSAIRSLLWEHILQTNFPHKKFALYDYHYTTSTEALSLSLFLSTHHLADDNGVHVGVFLATSEASLRPPVLSGEWGQQQLVSLVSTPSAKLEQDGWIFVNPSAIYHQNQEWFLDPKSLN